MSKTALPIRRFGMNLKAAMFILKRNAGHALRNFTAAAAAQQIHIIFMEIFIIPMKLDVNCKKNGSNVRL